MLKSKYLKYYMMDMVPWHAIRIYMEKLKKAITQGAVNLKARSAMKFFLLKLWIKIFIQTLKDQISFTYFKEIIIFAIFNRFS